MPVNKFDVNACLEAAMRANPNASREFLTRALSQTLTTAGQTTEPKDVDAYFDVARARVGWKYQGAPLHTNPAARYQAKAPKILDCAYVLAAGEVDQDGELDIESDEVLASSLGSSLHQALSEDGLDAGHIFVVDAPEGQPALIDEGDILVRVSIDEEGTVSVLDDSEDEKGARVRSALDGLKLPEGATVRGKRAEGVYTLQIGVPETVGES